MGEASWRSSEGRQGASNRSSALPHRQRASTVPGRPAATGSPRAARIGPRAAALTGRLLRPLVRTRGLDAAEAASQRHVRWRSRGRWWRGSWTRATTQRCHRSAGPLRPVQSRRPSNAARAPAMATARALRQWLAAPARAARSGGDTHALRLPQPVVPMGRGSGHARTSHCDHPWSVGRMPAGKAPRRAAQGAASVARAPRLCSGLGVVLRGVGRSKRNGENPRTV